MILWHISGIDDFLLFFTILRGKVTVGLHSGVLLSLLFTVLDWYRFTIFVPYLHTRYQEECKISGGLLHVFRSSKMCLEE